MPINIIKNSKLILTINILRCNLCGSNEANLKCTPQQESDVLMRVLECVRCGLMFVDPFPSKGNILSRYTHSYFHCDHPLEGGYEDYQKDEPLIQKTFERRWKLLEPLFRERKNLALLDVGCATGAFLDVMSRKDWDVSGLEVSDFAADAARKRGFKIFHGDFESVLLPENSFDLITMWDVIEHLTDPAEAIRRCFVALKPNGVLVLTTPDASSWFAKLTGSYWLGFRSLGEHLYFFTRSSLTSYLIKTGYVQTKISSVGKFLSWDRLLTRLKYYTRIFRILGWVPFVTRFKFELYVNSGDTMCVVAKKP